MTRSILLAALLALTITACGKKEESTTVEVTPPAATEAAPAAPMEAAPAEATPAPEAATPAPDGAPATTDAPK
ncbi:MAG: hypothetical protein H0W85_09620 [Methylotenera sp.]|nr:hypothetical protein [Methylotenera sp.]